VALKLCLPSYIAVPEERTAMGSVCVLALTGSDRVVFIQLLSSKNLFFENKNHTIKFVSKITSKS
jgi:hypothetical protein